MTGDRPAIGFEAFSAAVGLGTIAGGLSLVWPALDGLVGALASIAVAAAVARRTARPPGARAAFTAPESVAVGLAAIAGVVFLAAPGPIVPWRGFLLGVALVPWWWAERAVRPRPTAAGSGA